MITQSGRATISHRKGDSNINRFIMSLRKAEKRNEDFFEMPCPEYDVRVVYSNREYDELFGTSNEHVTHRGGGLLPSGTFLVYFDSLKELDIFSGGAFDEFVFHEINHVFYTKLVGSQCPFWLIEGLATYHTRTWEVDKEGWRTYFRGVSQLEKYYYYRWIKKRYYKDPGTFIVFSTLVYGYLYETFGKKKILTLLQEYSKKRSKKTFEKAFKRVFGIGMKQAAQEAIQTG